MNIKKSKFWLYVYLRENVIDVLSAIGPIIPSVVLTEQSAGVSEGSDLGVRHTSEQRQQWGKEECIINKAVPTRSHQNLGKFTQARFETL